MSVSQTTPRIIKTVVQWPNQETRLFNNDPAQIMLTEETLLTEENERDRCIQSGVKAQIIDVMGRKVTTATLDPAQFEAEATASMRTSLKNHTIFFISKFGRRNEVSLHELLMVALKTPKVQLPITFFQNFGSETIAEQRATFEKALVEVLPEIEITPFFRTKSIDTDWMIVVKEPVLGSGISFWDNVEAYTRAIIRKVALTKGLILSKEDFDIEVECNNLGIIFDNFSPNYITLGFKEFKIDLSIGRHHKNYLLKNTALTRDIESAHLTEDLSQLKVTLNPNGLDLLQILLFHNYGIMESDDQETRDHKAALQIIRRSQKGLVSVNGDLPIFLKTLLQKYPLNAKWSVIIAAKICNILKGHTEHPVEFILWKTLSLGSYLKFAPSELTDKITPQLLLDLWIQLPLVCFKENNELRKRELFFDHDLYKLIVNQEIPLPVVYSVLMLAGVLSISVPGRPQASDRLKITPTRHSLNRPALSFQMRPGSVNSIEFTLDFDWKTTLKALKDHADLLTHHTKSEGLLDFFVTYCTVSLLEGKAFPLVRKYEKNFGCSDPNELLEYALEGIQSTTPLVVIINIAILAYLSSLGYSKAEENLFLMALPALLKSPLSRLKNLGQHLASCYLLWADIRTPSINLFENEENKVFRRRHWYHLLSLTSHPRLCEIASQGWLSHIRMVDENYKFLESFFDKIFPISPHSAFTFIEKIALSELSEENVSQFFVLLWNKINSLPSQHPLLYHWENTILLADRFMNVQDPAVALPIIMRLYKRVATSRKDLLPLCYSWLSLIPEQNLPEIGVSGPIESILLLASTAKTSEEIDTLFAFILRHIKHPQIFFVLQKGLIKRIIPLTQMNRLRRKYLAFTAHPLKFRVALAISHMKTKIENVSAFKAQCVILLEEIQNLKEENCPVPLLINLLNNYSLSFSTLNEKDVTIITTALTLLLKKKHPLLEDIAEIIGRVNFTWLALQNEKLSNDLLLLLSYLLFQSENKPFSTIRPLILKLYPKYFEDTSWRGLFKQLKLVSMHKGDLSFINDLRKKTAPTDDLKQFTKDLEKIKIPIHAFKQFIFELNLDPIIADINKGSKTITQDWIELIQGGAIPEEDSLDILKRSALILLQNQMENDHKECKKWLCLPQVPDFFGRMFYNELLSLFDSSLQDPSIKALLWNTLKEPLEPADSESLKGIVARLISQWDFFSEDFSALEKWEHLTRIHPNLDAEQLKLWETYVHKLILESTVALQLQIFSHPLFEKDLPPLLTDPFQIFYTDLIIHYEVYFKHLLPFAEKYSKHFTFEIWTSLFEYVALTKEKKDMTLLATLWFQNHPFPSDENFPKISKREKCIHLSFMKRVYPQPDFAKIFYSHPQTIIEMQKLDENVKDYESIYINLLKYILKEPNAEQRISLIIIQIRCILSSLESKLTLDIDLQLVELSLSYGEDASLFLALSGIHDYLFAIDLKTLSNSQEKYLKKTCHNLLSYPLLAKSKCLTPALGIFNLYLKTIDFEDSLWVETLKWLIAHFDYMHSDEYFQEIIFFLVKNISHKSINKSYKQYESIFSESLFLKIVSALTHQSTLSTDYILDCLQAGISNGLIDKPSLQQCLYTFTTQEFLKFSIGKGNYVTSVQILSALNNFSLIAKSIYDMKFYSSFCQEHVFKAIFLLLKLDTEQFLKTSITFFSSTFLDPVQIRKRPLISLQSRNSFLLNTQKLTQPALNVPLFISLRIDFIKALLQYKIQNELILETVTHLSHSLLKTLIHDFMSGTLSSDQTQELITLSFSFFYLPYPTRLNAFPKIQEFRLNVHDEFSNTPKLFDNHKKELAAAQFFLKPWPYNTLPLPTLISSAVEGILSHSEYHYIDFLDRINIPEITEKLKSHSWSEIQVIVELLDQGLSKFQKFFHAYVSGKKNLCSFISNDALFHFSDTPPPELRKDILNTHLNILLSYIALLSRESPPVYSPDVLLSFFHLHSVFVLFPSEELAVTIFTEFMEVIAVHFKKIIEKKLFSKCEIETWNIYNNFITTLVKLYDITKEIPEIHKYLQDLIIVLGVVFDDKKLFENHFLIERRSLALFCFQSILARTFNVRSTMSQELVIAQDDFEHLEHSQDPKLQSHHDYTIVEGHNVIAQKMSKSRSFFGNALQFYYEWPKPLHDHIPVLFHLAFGTSDEIMTVEYTIAHINYASTLIDKPLILLHYQLIHWMKLYTFCSGITIYSLRKFQTLLYNSLKLFQSKNQIEFIDNELSLALECGVLLPENVEMDLFITELLESCDGSTQRFKRLFHLFINYEWFSNNLLTERKYYIILKYLQSNIPKDQVPNHPTFEELFERLFLNSVKNSILPKWIYEAFSYYKGDTSKLFFEGAVAAKESNDTSLALLLLLEVEIERFSTEEISLATSVIGKFLTTFHEDGISKKKILSVHRLAKSKTISTLLYISQKSLDDEIFQFLSLNTLFLDYKYFDHLLLWIKYYLQSCLNRTLQNPSHHFLEAISTKTPLLLKLLAHFSLENTTTVCNAFETIFKNILQHLNTIKPPQDKKFLLLGILLEAAGYQLLNESSTYITEQDYITTEQEYISYLTEVDPSIISSALTLLSPWFPCSDDKTRDLFNVTLLKIALKLLENAHDYEAEKVLKFFLKRNHESQLQTSPDKLIEEAQKLKQILHFSECKYALKTLLDTCVQLGLIDNDQIPLEQIKLYNRLLEMSDWIVAYNICEHYSLFHKVDCEVLIQGLLSLPHEEDTILKAVQTCKKYHCITDKLLTILTVFLKNIQASKTVLNEFIHILNTFDTSQVQPQLLYDVWGEILSQINPDTQEYFLKNLIENLLKNKKRNTLPELATPFLLYLYILTLQYSCKEAEALSYAISVRTLYMEKVPAEMPCFGQADDQLYKTLKLKLDWSLYLEKIFAILIDYLQNSHAYITTPLNHVFYSLIKQGLKVQYIKNKTLTYLTPFIKETFARFSITQKMKICVGIFRQEIYQMTYKKTLFESTVIEARAEAPKLMNSDAKYNRGLREIIQSFFLHYKPNDINDPYIKELKGFLSGSYLLDYIGIEVLNRAWEDLAIGIFSTVANHTATPKEFMKKYLNIIDAKDFLISGKTAPFRRILERAYTLIFNLLNAHCISEASQTNFISNLATYNQGFREYSKVLKCPLAIHPTELDNNIDLEKRVNSLWSCNFDGAVVCYFIYQLNKAKWENHLQMQTLLIYLFQYSITCFTKIPTQEMALAIEEFLLSHALFLDEISYLKVLKTIDQEVRTEKLKEKIVHYPNLAFIIEYTLEKELFKVPKISKLEKFTFISDFMIKFIKTSSWFRLSIICSKLDRFMTIYDDLKMRDESFDIFNQLLKVFQALIDNVPCNDLTIVSLNKLKKPLLNFCIIDNYGHTDVFEERKKELFSKYLIIIEHLHLFVIISRNYPLLIPGVFKAKIDTIFISYINVLYNPKECTEQLELFVTDLGCFYHKEMTFPEEKRQLNTVKTILLVSIKEFFGFVKAARGDNDQLDFAHHAVALLLKLLAKNPFLEKWVEEWLENDILIKKLGEEILTKDSYLPPAEDEPA